MPDNSVVDSQCFVALASFGWYIHMMKTLFQDYLWCLNIEAKKEHAYKCVFLLSQNDVTVALVQECKGSLVMIKGNSSLSRQKRCFLDGMTEQYIYLFSPRKYFFIEK